MVLKGIFKNQLIQGAKTPDMWMMSFPNLHKMAGRATPDKLIYYKLALQLFRVVNYHIPTPDWINVNLNNIQTTRQTKFITQRTNRLKIGMNILSNRFYYLNGKIDLDYLTPHLKTNVRKFSSSEHS